MFNSPHLLIILNSKQPDVSIVFYKQSVNLYEAFRKDIRKLPRETQETYLIENYSVTNILAASVTNTDDRLPKNPTILGFGLSQSTTLTNPTRNFGSLPFVPYELDAIIQPPAKTSGIFPGQKWLDQDFTLDRLTTGLLDKPNILHIATHGEFLDTNPKGSYLVLGDNTAYPISQIQNLRNP